MKKPNIKTIKIVLFYFYTTLSQRQIYRGRNQSLPGTENVGRRGTQSIGGLSVVMKILCNMILVTLQDCIHLSKTRTAYLKRLKFIVLKL